MLFEINYWYTEKYYPTKRHHKLCERIVYDSTSIEVREVASECFPVAFIIKEFRDQKEGIEIRAYGGKLYRALKYSEYVPNASGWLPLDYIKTDLESYLPFDVGGKNFSEQSIVMESNKNAVLSSLNEQVATYLIFDDRVWQVCGEPLYCVKTSDAKKGRVNLSVEFFCDSVSAENTYFNSLHRQEAIDYVKSLSLDCGTNSNFVEDCTIEVLIPEMVNNSQKVNYDGDFCSGVPEGAVIDSRDIVCATFSALNVNVES